MTDPTVRRADHRDRNGARALPGHDRWLMPVSSPPTRPEHGAAARASCECSCGRTLFSIATPSFEVAECEYRPHGRFSRHPHDRAGFCLVLDGGFEELDERRGASAIRHEPATLVYHPAGAAHTNVISDRGSRCLTVEIAPAVLSSLEGRTAVAGALNVSRRGAAHWFAYKLREELHSRDDLTPLLIDGVALALLGEFARRPGVRADRPPPAWLGQTRERLHEEFASPPSLAALAAAAGVHRVHLARAFRAHYACTVGEYVRQRRIEHACRRLATTDTPLSEIALSAGFADQSHFTTTFRRLVGITPSAFRARAASAPR